MLQRFKQWIIRNYKQGPADIEQLVWVERTLTNDNKVYWDYVDTVDYDIESIPTRKELIIDCHAKQMEVIKNELLEDRRRKVCEKRN